MLDFVNWIRGLDMIALWGAITGTIALVVHLWKFFGERKPRIVLHSQWVMTPREARLFSVADRPTPLPVITLEVSNVGQRPTKIRAVKYEFYSQRSALPFKDAPDRVGALRPSDLHEESDPLPYKLECGEIWCGKFEIRIASALLKEGFLLLSVEGPMGIRPHWSRATLIKIPDEML